MKHALLDVLIVRLNPKHNVVENKLEGYDVESMEKILIGSQEKISLFNSFFRDMGYAVDFKMTITDETGQPIYTLLKDTTYFKSIFYVLDGENVRIAQFLKSRTKNDIAICNDDDEPIGFINREGLLKRSYHVLTAGQHHVASIAAKDLSSFEEFSRRDNTFAIEVDDGVARDEFLRKLLVPAVVYINWFGL